MKTKRPLEKRTRDQILETYHDMRMRKGTRFKKGKKLFDDYAIVEGRNHYGITLPKDWCDSKGIKRKDRIRIQIKKNELIITLLKNGNRRNTKRKK